MTRTILRESKKIRKALGGHMPTGQAGIF